MKYKTAFRLALRAIGILVLADVIPNIVDFATNLTVDVLAPWRGATVAFRFLRYEFIDDLVGLAIGFYLFLGGKWIANLAVPSNRPYCHECGYELTGNVTGVCPECGTPNAPGSQTSNARIP